MGSLVTNRNSEAALAGRRLGAVMLCVVAGTVQATEGDALKASVSSSISYDSNIFRLPDSVDAATLTGRSQRSDLITSIALGVAFDHVYGRQRVSAELRGKHNDFAEFDFLDNQSYDGRALVQWQIGNDWSGELGYTRARALTSFGDFRLPVKNMQTSERPWLVAKYRLGASWSARAQVAQANAENSAAALRRNDREERTYEAGIDFLPATGNTIGAFVRHTDGNLPNRAVAGAATDKFGEDTIGSIFNWRLTGASVVSGYVGYTQRGYEAGTQRDFDGVSGRLAFDWLPTGKSRLTVAARRQVEPYEDTTTTYALTNAVSVSGNWDATAKITVSARAEYRGREFLGDTGASASGVRSREDTTRSIGGGIIFKAFRNVELAAGIGRETRSSSRALLDYSVNTASITAQVTF